MRINERALTVILAMVDNYSDLDESWPDHEKEEITFSRLALDEMLNLIWDNPLTLASEIIEDFELNCRINAAESSIPEQKRIFIIAAQTALEIYDNIKEVEK